MEDEGNGTKKVISLSGRLRKGFRTLFGRQTVERWNRTRLAELVLEERNILHRETNMDNFPRPTGFVCSGCGQIKVHDEAHIDHTERFWKRQTICYSCGQSVYRYL